MAARSQLIRITTVLTFQAASCDPSPAVACFNLANGEPRTLTGMLDHQVFPGPPNYEDIEKGDAPEAAYILRLAAPICIDGDLFADPERLFRDVQLLEANPGKGQLKAYLHRKVSVSLTSPMPAQTGHHHKPLVAWVVSIVAK